MGNLDSCRMEAHLRAKVRVLKVKRGRVTLQLGSDLPATLREGDTLVVNLSQDFNSTPKT